jgi:hypothetical protein
MLRLKQNTIGTTTLSIFERELVTEGVRMLHMSSMTCIQLHT